VIALARPTREIPIEVVRSALVDMVAWLVSFVSDDEAGF
jgi:hypothetical protein